MAYLDDRVPNLQHNEHPPNELLKLVRVIAGQAVGLLHSITAREIPISITPSRQVCGGVGGWRTVPVKCIAGHVKRDMFWRNLVPEQFTYGA